MKPLRKSTFVPPAGARVSCEMVDAGPPLTPEQIVTWCDERGYPAPNRPAIPTADELAKLPANARTAFLARCAARVAALVPQPAPAALDPLATAAILLAAATVRTPLRRMLGCIRRDYDRLFFLSKQKKWTDDSPVPENAFGPLWPKDLPLPWEKV